MQSLEDRNSKLLAKCFPVRELHSEAGVLYEATIKPTLRNDELAVVTHLEYGYGQFFADGGAGSLSRSLWLASEGFFYHLALTPAQTANKKFLTADWVVKAGMGHGKKKQFRIKGRECTSMFMFFT